MLTAEVLAKTNKLNREEWLQLRRQGLGGSDAAAAAGLNKWKSPLALWLEKTGQVELPEPGEAAYWGSMLEDVLAREFSRQTGLKVKRRNALLRHQRHHYMLANVDRLVVGQETGLECKTTGQYNQQDWEEKRIPYEYLLQCQHYLAVTGFKTWYIAVLIGGNKFTWREIKRDDQIIHYLIKIEADFWRHVTSGQPPVPDGTESSSEVLKLLYPQSVPESKITLPETALELVETYDKAREAEEQAREEKDKAANQLKYILGEYETGLIGHRQVNWKTVESARLDPKALKVAHPDIYARYAKVNTTRRFTVK